MYVSYRMSEACGHKENPICDETCVCTCNECQERFEIEWAKRVEERGLCDGCGMPKELTLERLKEERDSHFFQPCEICKPAFLALMKQNKMCATCQQYLQSEACKDCFCTEQPYTCECRQCKAYRKSVGE